MNSEQKLTKVQNAIDAIIDLEDIEEIPNDRYRETLGKLRDDEADFVID